jgi:hypothetical protein
VCARLKRRGRRLQARTLLGAARECYFESASKSPRAQRRRGFSDLDRLAPNEISADIDDDTLDADAALIPRMILAA